MSETQVKYNRWLQKVFEDENIENPKIEIVGESRRGDGFMGQLDFIKVISENGKILNLVVKSWKRDPNDPMPLEEAFGNEICFYQDILPELLKLQVNLNSNILSVPKCYCCYEDHTYQVIILEDLKTKGFKLWDRTKCLDFNHVELVLKEYAKFHALSFAFQKNNPQLIEVSKKKLINLYKCFHKAGKLDFPLQIFRDYYKIAPNEQKEKLKKIEDEFIFILLELESTCDPSILIHGDAWVNNMLFNYLDNKPTAVTILDFQYLRSASPIFDISFFIYGSCSQKEIDRLEELHEIYYINLSKFLAHLEIDPEEVFSRQLFEDHWKRFSKIGFALAPLLLKLSLANEDEVPTGEIKSDATFLENEIKSFEIYYQRLKTVLHHFLDKQYI